MESSMSLFEIDKQLAELAKFVANDDLGHVVEKEAWRAVDELLDARNELGRVAVDVELESGK